MKRLVNTRVRTQKQLDQIIVFLGKHYEGFKDLPEEKQMDRAMRFFQCEKGMLQKGKIYADLFFHLVPVIISLIALLVAYQK